MRTPKKSIVFNGQTLYSIPQAAEMTGFAAHYLRKLVREGKLTGRRIGSQWWFERKTLFSELETTETIGTLSVASYSKASKIALAADL